jgi:elongation factor 2
LEERVKPVLFINKIDRLIDELKLDSDEIESKLARIVVDFNTLIEVHGESGFKEKWKVDAAKETVVFGSALHKWGFTSDMIRQNRMKFADIMENYKEGRHQALSRILQLHTAILDMAVRNLPSPVEAQRYRIPKIWRGNHDSAMGRALMNCADRGPTTMCITNVQIDANNGPIATGRLFSGSVKEGDQVYLVEANRECRVKQVFMYMSAFRESVNRIPSGNLAALSGLDLVRAGETVVDNKHKEGAVPFEGMRYISEPVITVAVEPKDPKDLPSLRKALDRLAVEDPNLAVKIDERSGEYLLSGMGELHLETSVTFLKDYSGGIEIATSKPTADYRESVTRKGLIVLARSPNRQNSFKVQTEPYEETKGSAAQEKVGDVWAVDEHRSILINLTKDGGTLEKVKDSIISGFHWACRTGPLCEQPMRDVKVNLIDARIQEEPTLREPKQIMRAVSRAIFGSFLTARPTLLEPVYKIELSTATRWFGKSTSILVSRRGKIWATENKATITMITGYIPVAETFGLSAEMRSSTSGRVFWQSIFDHWEEVPQKIATEIIKQIRIRRGLPPEIPKPHKFVDEA